MYTYTVICLFAYITHEDTTDTGQQPLDKKEWLNGMFC